VSGYRSGAGESDSGRRSGVAGGVMSCLMGGDNEIVMSRFSGRRVGVLGGLFASVEAIEVDSDLSGIIGLFVKSVSMCTSTARKIRRAGASVSKLQ